MPSGFITPQLKVLHPQDYTEGRNKCLGVLLEVMRRGAKFPTLLSLPPPSLEHCSSNIELPVPSKRSSTARGGPSYSNVIHWLAGNGYTPSGKNTVRDLAA